jgi:hypothetical protein
MRLFNQLSEQEQSNVIEYCADLVIEDILENGVIIDTVSDKEIALKEKMETALEFASSLEDKEQQISYLLGDIDISTAIFDMAIDMAKTAYFHDCEELVIFPAHLEDGDDEEELGPKEQQSEDDVLAAGIKNKKYSQLN